MPKGPGENNGNQDEDFAALFEAGEGPKNDRGELGFSSGDRESLSRRSLVDRCLADATRAFYRKEDAEWKSRGGVLSQEEKEKSFNNFRRNFSSAALREAFDRGKAETYISSMAGAIPPDRVLGLLMEMGYLKGRSSLATLKLKKLKRIMVKREENRLDLHDENLPNYDKLMRRIEVFLRQRDAGTRVVAIITGAGGYAYSELPALTILVGDAMRELIKKTNCRLVQFTICSLKNPSFFLAELSS